MTNKVLIMDYSKFEREKIKYILKNIGAFSVLEFESSLDYHDSHANLDNLKFIIMDIEFPFENDGFNVLSDIRKNPITKNIPVIITTKSNSPENKKRSLQFAVNDYILKPFSIKRLENSINSLIKIDKVFSYEVNGLNNITMSFEDYIIKELKTCSRVNQPLSIIFTTPVRNLTTSKTKADKSKFDRKIFSFTAERLKNVLRATDTVILNNSDILTILPFTDSSNAKLVHKKSRENIENCLQKLNTNYDKYFYSVIVSFPEDGIDFQSLMEVVSKKITDKKLLEKLVSIPLDPNNIYTNSKYRQFKNYTN